MTSHHRADNAQNILATIAERVNHLLEERGISQAEMARSLGVSEITVSRLCRAKHNPAIDLLVRVADVYDLSTDHLLGRD